MSDFELAILAAQTRANLMLLREYVDFGGCKASFAVVDDLLAGLINDSLPRAVAEGGAA